MRQQIVEHIQKHIGPIAGVIDSYESEFVSVDVCHVPPSPGLDAHALFTLTTPASPREGPHAEVCAFLPRDWRIVSMHDVQADEDLARHHWPLRWMVNIARMRDEYGVQAQAFAHGLLVGNGAPPSPYTDDTAFCSLVLMRPAPLPASFGTLHTPTGEVHFLRMTPLFAEEESLKRSRGMAALEEAISRVGLAPLEMFVHGRANAGKKKFLGLF